MNKRKTFIISLILFAFIIINTNLKAGQDSLSKNILYDDNLTYLSILSPSFDDNLIYNDDNFFMEHNFSMYLYNV
ncbi:MAG: hypothetical protein ACOCUI_04145, partial [bacterium]